jgi:hypothetical protein
MVFQVAPALTQTFGVRVESGGGDNAISLDQEFMDGVETMMIPVVASADSGSQPMRLADSANQSESLSWRNACTACFEQEAIRQSAVDNGSSDNAGSGEQNAAFDPLAALLGSTVILGGYWAGKREATRKRGGLVLRR